MIDLRLKHALVELSHVMPTVTVRGPRFVDHCTCPMCGVDQLGLEYQGELRSGVKVHTIATHTEGMRRVERGQPRCLGSGVKMVFEGGTWKGAAS